MAFSYQFGSNPGIDFPRMLIGDTVECGHVFEDSEIQSAYVIVQSQIQSSMRYSFGAGQNLPSSPVSYLRVAALLLDSLASSSSRLAGVTKLLDVQIDIGRTATQLREQAREWREVDDDAGAFMIIEQSTTTWAFRDRFWSQVQRQLTQ